MGAIEKSEETYLAYTRPDDSFRQLGRHVWCLPAMAINNKELTNNKDIVNALNTHFSTTGKNLADKVIPQENNSFKAFLTDPIKCSLYLRPTNSDEIIKEINQLKNKATLDIRVTLVKYVKQELVDGVVIIFNKSFQEGCFPEVLKLAKVIPIH